MEKKEGKMHKFGLVGKNISYSFSRGYFTEKFKTLGLNSHTYVNFDLNAIDAFTEVVEKESTVRGFNVTIPYKEVIIPYLTSLDKEAEEIGAVNTIRVDANGDLKGFNTDVYGFKKSIEPFLKPTHKQALILGTGGASKAVAFVLKQLGIASKLVSRKPKEQQLSYADLNADLLQNYKVIVNCTPLGTHPNITQKPDIPYEYLTADHLLFDLIYNPEKTAFLKEGEARGAAICNGYRMLELQAEKAWEIWNSKP